MEDHPVPQNVTSFEFHLVGDMTLKQFAYLATGCAIAYISFVAIVPINPFFGYPMILFPALIGAAFAFMPISDRPLDHWVQAFFQAIFAPTKMSWSSPVRKFDQKDPFFQKRLQVYLSTITPPPSQPQLLKNSSQPIGNLKPLPSRLTTPRPVATPVNQAPTASSNMINPVPPQSVVSQTVPVEPSASELDKLVNLAKEAQMIQVKIAATEQQLHRIQNTPATPTFDHNQQMQLLHTNLQTLINHAQLLSREISQTIKKPESRTKPAIVKVIIPEKRSSNTVSLTTFPNIINGIVSDNQGNSIEGVIAIIHNQEGLPVRALKTNKLGQFTGATSLPSGIYTLTIEKEDLEFDTLQVSLNDTVLAPILITPKPTNQMPQNAVENNPILTNHVT